ncbi:MAG TPA: DUF5666 domain-containing protein [Myxococcota bacterium]|nr:DUF5666 domain-containing protein [Myxococcota bacterium]
MKIGTTRAAESSRLILGVLLAALLAACSGGGGSGDGASPTTVGSTGVITGFSSVFVNGVRYEVEGGTVVAVEGEGERLGDDSPLRIGMKVRIRASERAGRRFAERIEFDDDLKGPARNVTPDPMDPSLGRFTVIGRTVIVDANTIFDDDIGDNDGDPGVDLRDLEPVLFPGNAPVVVSVSGFPTAEGLLATRIDRVNAAAGGIGRPDVDDDELELKGFVDSIASDGSEFVVGGTTFVIDDDTLFEDDLPMDDDLVGRFVEVKADLLGNGDLLAVRIESEDDFDDDDDRRGELEIEGILQSVDLTTDPDQIVIDGRTIEVRDASGLEGRVGSRVEIEGRFDADGVLVIRESKLEVENSVRTEDRVASVDREAGRFTTRLGLVITPTGTSRLEDDDSDDDEGDRLTPSEFLDRVDFDDFVEARGVPGSDGSVRWTRIELDDDDDLDCRLRGPVQSISGEASSFEIVIQGVTVRTDGVDDDDFEGDDDDSIGRSGFFDQLDVGDVVEATSFEGDSACQSGLLDARELEFEPEDGLVGSVPPGRDDDDDDDDDDGFAGNPFIGTPTDVTESTFVLPGRTIQVVGSTRIDDSIIESALGRELDGDDRRFDQVPDGLGLPQLLTGSFPVRAVVAGDGTAFLIEDLD